MSVSGRLVADDWGVLREAAVCGLGIARLPTMHVGEAVRRGALVSVLDEYAPPPTPLHLVYFAGLHLPPRTRAFIEFMRPRLAREVADATKR